MRGRVGGKKKNQKQKKEAHKSKAFVPRSRVIKTKKKMRAAAVSGKLCRLPTRSLDRQPSSLSSFNGAEVQWLMCMEACYRRS